MTEQTAAAEREQLLTTDALGHFWRGEPLQPWTHRRELLFLALQNAAGNDLTVNVANTLESLEFIEVNVTQKLAENGLQDTSPDAHIHWPRFLPAASCVLWLASHTPEQWSHFRADTAAWLRQIEDWADEMIAADEIIPAVRLARDLRLAHRALITLPRPDATTKRRDAGN